MDGTMSGAKILFLGKPNDARTQMAAETLKASSAAEVEEHYGEWGSPFPAADWQGDVIVSYLCRWIVPAATLKNARLAINFHPAPPGYPGRGGTNFALYNGDKEFGVMCHYMAPRVDSGTVIKVHRFPILDDDTVASLSERSWDALLALFLDMLPTLLTCGPFHCSSESWGTVKRTTADLDDLATLDASMDAAEIARRTRATTYGRFKPTWHTKTAPP
jgi:methionyl-tRNA formyltransferase